MSSLIYLFVTVQDGISLKINLFTYLSVLHSHTLLMKYALVEDIDNWTRYLRRGVAKWVARMTRNVEVVGSQAPVVSLSKKRYPYCVVLVGSRNGFESNFTIELNYIEEKYGKKQQHNIGFPIFILLLDIYFDWTVK